MENFPKTRRSFLKLCGFAVAVPISALKALGSSEKKAPAADNWIAHPGELAVYDGEQWRFIKETEIDEESIPFAPSWAAEWAKAAAEEIDREILKAYKRARW